MAGIVVVFDFDKTIIEVDSDNWVVDELGATDLFNQLLPTMPWNSLMVSFLFLFILAYFFWYYTFLLVRRGLCNGLPNNKADNLCCVSNNRIE